MLSSPSLTIFQSIFLQQKQANEILNHLKEHPESWTRVDTILEFSQNQQTKYYALQILEKTIKTKWKALPRNQCDAIKKYIVGLIIKKSSEAAVLEREKVYVNKLNLILIQVSISLSSTTILLSSCLHKIYFFDRY